MGNQQLLMLTLTTVLVSIAVAVGIGMVKDSDVESVGDEMQQHLMSIATDMYTFSMKPSSMGGGSGSIKTYSLADNDKATPNAVYVSTGTQGTGLAVIATPQRTEYQGKIIMTLTFGAAPGLHNSALKIRFYGSGIFKKYSVDARPFGQ